MKITDADIVRIAKANGIEPAAVNAVKLVESAGSGFLSDGVKPKILFEGHKFWQQLVINKIDPNAFVKGNENILYPVWTKQFYSATGEGEYLRLEKAKKISYVCALMSASWGLFQIMGFNFKACGFNTIGDYVQAMYTGESNQLEAFINFIKNDSGGNKLQYLKNKDWKSFAFSYNGAKYSQNQYDIKLAKAYDSSLYLNKL